MTYLTEATRRLIEAQNQCLILCRQAVDRIAPELAPSFAPIPWTPAELGRAYADIPSRAGD